MKANKAPEKIYITPHFKRRWFTKEIDDASVEYTRTDAFLKKAEEFFEENIEEEECKIGCTEWVELKSQYKSLDSFIRAFRNYLKASAEAKQQLNSQEILATKKNTIIQEVSKENGIKCPSEPLLTVSADCLNKCDKCIIKENGGLFNGPCGYID